MYRVKIEDKKGYSRLGGIRPLVWFLLLARRLGLFSFVHNDLGLHDFEELIAHDVGAFDLAELSSEVFDIG
jgi:hypothetical protein